MQTPGLWVWDRVYVSNKFSGGWLPQGPHFKNHCTGELKLLKISITPHCGAHYSDAH